MWKYEEIGLIEIKCSNYKKNSKINDLVNNQSIHVKCRDGAPVLKEDHANSYYTQTQLTMGLSQGKFSSFNVYTFDGTIITRPQFGEDFFFSNAKPKNWSF